MDLDKARRSDLNGSGSVWALAGGLMVAQQPAPPVQAPEQLLSPEQLDTLVAPVALCPNALLSQGLVAATYLLEIAEAGQRLQQNRNIVRSFTATAESAPRPAIAPVRQMPTAADTTPAVPIAAAARTVRAAAHTAVELAGDTVIDLPQALQKEA